MCKNVKEMVVTWIKESLWLYEQRNNSLGAKHDFYCKHSQTSLNFANQLLQTTHNQNSPYYNLILSIHNRLFPVKAELSDRCKYKLGIGDEQFRLQYEEKCDRIKELYLQGSILAPFVSLGYTVKTPVKRT